ncbi:MAG: sigma-70 family RNA polymerase sigma factor [Leptospiraceae bacterium]|nr:sigma-70 family RNA polymerase sigma factor [Leptospiraceae bacterium]
MNSKEFSSIVAETKPIVLSSIGKFLNKDYFDSLDDVVQETYLRAFKALSKNQFRGDAKISTWLYGIARNESLRMNDKLDRQNAKKEKLLLKRKEDLRIFSNPENLLDTVLDFLKKIPLQYRLVLEKQLENKSEKEISVELNLPKGTIKSRAARGKELLKKMVKENES